MILFLLRATSNALATLPGPPYSLPSSSSNVVDSAQPEPPCTRERRRGAEASPAQPWPTLQGSSSLSHARTLSQGPSGDMEAQTNELAAVQSNCQHRAAPAGRLSTKDGLFRCNYAITDPLLILHLLVPPLSLPYPPTLRIHTHYHHRLFSVSSPPLPSLFTLSGLSVFRTPLKSCSSLYTL